MDFPLGIGALAEATGCKIETIRYYEKESLLPAPPRSPGGHRLYSPDHLKRLTFLRRCRDLGFTMAEIRELLSLIDSERYTCQEINALTMIHVGIIREKLRDLKRLESALVEMADACQRDERPECPIVDALYEPLRASRSQRGS